MKFFGLIELTKRLFGVLTQGEEMAKEDIVQAGVGAIQSGVVQVYSDELGKAYDGGFQDGVASVPVSEGGFSQEQLDQAVADGVAAQKAADDLADAQLKADFDALVSKEAVEAELIGKLKALLFPAA